jgi:curved DNA-binding protein CbpA
MSSLYEVLEVSPNARDAVIKAAWRCLVQQCHPDRNASDPAADKRLALINQAYAVLSDPAQRARYDRSAGFTRTDRRGTGKTAHPASNDGAQAPRMRPFVFRKIA